MGFFAELSASIRASLLPAMAPSGSLIPKYHSQYWMVSDISFPQIAMLFLFF